MFLIFYLFKLLVWLLDDVCYIFKFIVLLGYYVFIFVLCFEFFDCLRCMFCLMKMYVLFFCGDSVN